MHNNTEDQELEKLLQTVFESLKDKKGEEIIDLDISHLNTTICDHFVICHAASTTRVRALADSVEEKMRQNHKMKPFHKEGMDNAQWVLLDFDDIIVHVFQEPYRRFYNLEDLWADGISREIED
jgi:ribosome-associated protein